MERDTPKCIKNVEDVVKKLFIFNNINVLVVVFPMLELGNIIGLKRWFKEEEKVQEEWLIKLKWWEEQKMVLDIKLSPKPNQEHRLDNYIN